MSQPEVDPRLWRYVQGPADDAERAALEQELKSNPLLREQADKIRRLNDRLKVVLPLVASARPVEELAADSWAAEQGLDVQGRPRLRRVRARAVYAVAAACVIIGLGIYRYQQPSLVWTPARVLIAATRGAGEASVSRDRLEDCAADLERVVQSLHKAHDRRSWVARMIPGGPLWSMRTAIEALPRGDIRIDIQAFHGTAGVAGQEWTRTYPDTDSMEKDVPRLALEVSSGLTDRL